MTTNGTGWTRRRFGAAMLLLAAGSRAGAEGSALSPALLPAPLPVQTEDFDWVDAIREREVPVRLYWPQGAAAVAKVPLVVFSHGLGGSRWGYSYLGSFWASQGYASLHVQHVGSDRSLWGGNRLTLVWRLQAAAQESEAIHRVHDMRFALDSLLAGPHGAQIDQRRIVAAGHSYGANTTLLLAGARISRNGAPVDHRDPRFSAAVVMSAPPFYGEGDPVRILRPVQVPTLHVTATEDTITIPGYGSDVSDRLATFDAVGSVRKTLAMFEGGSHSIFTDRGHTGGAELNPQVKEATRELSLAFFSSIYDGDASGLERWGERWRPIVARYLTLG